jgi:hypothetical protein
VPALDLEHILEHGQFGVEWAPVAARPSGPALFLRALPGQELLRGESESSSPDAPWVVRRARSTDASLVRGAGPAPELFHIPGAVAGEPGVLSTLLPPCGPGSGLVASATGGHVTLVSDRGGDGHVRTHGAGAQHTAAAFVAERTNICLLSSADAVAKVCPT